MGNAQRVLGIFSVNAFRAVETLPEMSEYVPYLLSPYLPAVLQMFSMARGQ
jgi:hypothetical protein